MLIIFQPFALRARARMRASKIQNCIYGIFLMRQISLLTSLPSASCTTNFHPLYLRKNFRKPDDKIEKY